MSISASSPQVATTFSERLRMLIENPPPLVSDEEAARRDAAEREVEFRRRLDRSGMPPRYREASLSTCCPEASAYAERIISGEGANLLLAGESGDGKTHTACAVLKAFMWRTGKMGRFVTMDGLLDEIKATFDCHGSEEAVKSKYANSPLLVIDEFGKARSSEWSLPIIEAVVNDRYNLMRPTIVTTQFKRDRLAEQFAAVDGGAERAKAVIRRLTEGAVMAKAVNPNG